MPVHLGVWAASLVFLVSNVVLVMQLLKHVQPSSVFVARAAGSVSSSSSTSGVVQKGSPTPRKQKRKPALGELSSPGSAAESPRSPGVRHAGLEEFAVGLRSPIKSPGVRVTRHRGAWH